VRKRHRLEIYWAEKETGASRRKRRERDRGEKETAVRKTHRLEIHWAEKETGVRKRQR
jgi:hypothetical protein